MDILVCKKCGKVKKSKSDPSHKRISGEKVFERLEKWLNKNPQFKEQVKIRQTGCMDQCKKSPVLFIRDQRKFYKRLTKEKLSDVIKELEKDLTP